MGLTEQKEVKKKTDVINSVFRNIRLKILKKMEEERVTEP